MSDLMEGIKNLREITGAGFLDCKKALEENIPCPIIYYEKTSYGIRVDASEFTEKEKT